MSGIKATITLAAYTPGTYSSDVLVPLDANYVDFATSGNLLTALGSKGIKIGAGNYGVGPHLALIFDDSTSSTTQLAQTANTRTIEIGISGISTNKALADKIAAGINTHGSGFHDDIDYTATVSGSGNGEVVITIINSLQSVVGSNVCQGESGLTGFGGGFGLTFGAFQQNITGYRDYRDIQFSGEEYTLVQANAASADGNKAFSGHTVMSSSIVFGGDPNATSFNTKLLRKGFENM